ncbi:hypothetical protein CKJ84_10375 [Corynebacterium sp. NML 120412]|uniref:hypothetical protein n=1 Tax=Corynebacterium sp. NML 120412 TaxID=2029401 RepID=UPI000BAA4FE4|nr:hypothetical protein [Corynebacterium sp. NML 120412]PAT14090.1 hypothetical protein CKJ84_10375 [Corynebacterium sp. NML 120412]
MGSTLYSEHLAPVIQLSPGATFMVRVALASDEEVYRWVGLDSTTTIDECREIIAALFGIEEKVGTPEQGMLIDVLSSPGDTATFTWGLWQFTMQLADIYPGTSDGPVCVAGEGAFGGADLDLDAVRQQLAASQLRPEVREVIHRAESFDFVPLLQVIADGEPSLPAQERARLAALLPESAGKTSDAFWVHVLVMACFADEPTTRKLALGLMRALGWEDTDADEVFTLSCAGQAFVGDLSAVDRLEILRELLHG